MKKLSLVMAIGVLLTAPGLTNAWQDQTNLRTWNVPDGQSLDAELVSFDQESGEVTLRGEDGELIEMQATDLHISDRRYLDRQMARQNRRQRQRASSDPIDRALAGNAGSRTDRSALHLYGIDWHRNPASAARAASGKETVSDDKPVIWFRVLGDLSGFM
ncbi:MAG: hypothetical protein ACR2NP_02465 [Pirellulaceae bacterium]